MKTKIALLPSFSPNAPDPVGECTSAIKESGREIKCICMYIMRERERDREGERNRNRNRKGERKRQRERAKDR